MQRTLSFDEFCSEKFGGDRHNAALCVGQEFGRNEFIITGNYKDCSFLVKTMDKGSFELMRSGFYAESNNGSSPFVEIIDILHKLRMSYRGLNTQNGNEMRKSLINTISVTVVLNIVMFILYLLFGRLLILYILVDFVAALSIINKAFDYYLFCKAAKLDEKHKREYGFGVNP